MEIGGKGRAETIFLLKVNQLEEAKTERKKQGSITVPRFSSQRSLGRGVEMKKGQPGDTT